MAIFTMFLLQDQLDTPFWKKRSITEMYDNSLPVDELTKRRFLLQNNLELSKYETKYNFSLMVATKPLNNRTLIEKPKQILFYNPATYQLSRNINSQSKFSFKICEISRCVMTFKKADVYKSDAIILLSMKGQNLKKKSGQVWIVLQQESPQMHQLLYHRNAPVHLSNKINWTMTYSKNADIYLPYGRFRHLGQQRIQQRDYVQIANSKSKDAVWIVSHCKTYSKREDYVKILRQYISVDIFGRCGRKLKCGKRFLHDSCFDILNTTYRYYLAFENSLCQEYITEKFFENYHYDIIQVVRADIKSNTTLNINSNAYINANAFKNAHELGKYLKSLSTKPEIYASMLRQKEEYEVISYKDLFQNAACEICKRLHSTEKYMSLYPSMHQWMIEKEPCVNPKDL